jgi:hypothetical protein
MKHCLELPAHVARVSILDRAARSRFPGSGRNALFSRHPSDRLPSRACRAGRASALGALFPLGALSALGLLGVAGCRSESAAPAATGSSPTATGSSPTATPASAPAPSGGASASGTLQGSVTGAVERTFTTSTAHYGAKHQRFHFAFTDSSSSTPQLVISFSRPGNEPPAAGSYALGALGIGDGGFSGSLEVYGSPQQEFDITSGKLELTTPAPDVIAGSFSFEAKGSTDTSGTLTATGTFSARPMK